MKIVHVVYINDYFPELWKYTFPSIEYYARKIGAELNVITERKFPDWHIHYEKTQVWEAGKNADANILFDSDILIHPEFPDFNITLDLMIIISRLINFYQMIILLGMVEM